MNQQLELLRMCNQLEHSHCEYLFALSCEAGNSYSLSSCHMWRQSQTAFVHTQVHRVGNA